jgi:hypothetical protein
MRIEFSERGNGVGDEVAAKRVESLGAIELRGVSLRHSYDQEKLIQTLIMPI